MNHKMSEAFVFPVTVKPQPSESILGYLKRLAVLLKFDSVSALSGGKLFLTPITDITIAVDTKRLAKALGDQWQALKASHIAPEGSKFSFHGHILEKEKLHLSTMKICPACIEENPYHRNHWHLAALDTCETHGVSLTDKCFHCSATLTWNSPGVDLCSECNGRIKLSGPQVPSASGALAARILLTICGLREEDQTEPVPPVLAGLSLKDAIDFLDLLGRLRRHVEPSDNGGGSSAELVAGGIQLAREWPSSFYRELTALETLNRKCGRSPFTLLQPFYREIVKVPFSTWGSRIQAALIKHLAYREDLIIDIRHPLRDHIFKMSTFCPIEEVLEVLGINRDGLRQLRETSAWNVQTQIHEGREWFKFGHIIELKERMTGDVLGYHSRPHRHTSYDWRTPLQLKLPGMKMRARKKPVPEAEG